MLIPRSGLFIAARDWRKGSMAGSESCPQLISIRILTCLSNAAVLMASSMTGQYLLNKQSKVKKCSKNWQTDLWKQLVSVCVGRFTFEDIQSVWWGSTPWRPHQRSVGPLRCWREWPPGPESSMEGRMMVENPAVKHKYRMIIPQRHLMEKTWLAHRGQWTWVTVLMACNLTQQKKWMTLDWSETWNLKTHYESNGLSVLSLCYQFKYWKYSTMSASTLHALYVFLIDVQKKKRLGACLRLGLINDSASRA